MVSVVRRLLTRKGNPIMIETETCSDSTAIWRPSGDLDIASAVPLRHLVGDILRSELDLVIDLDEVTFVDAVGISALVGAIRRVRAAGGTARVSNINPRVRWVLELVGVEQLLTQSRR